MSNRNLSIFVMIPLCAVLCLCGCDDGDPESPQTIIVLTDSESPTVVITEPRNDQIIDGPVLIRARVSDDHEVDRVVFTVNDEPIVEVSAMNDVASYRWNPLYWLGDSSVLLKAVAFDATGNASEPDSVTLEISESSLALRPVFPSDGYVWLLRSSASIPLDWEVGLGAGSTHLQVARDSLFTVLELDEDLGWRTSYDLEVHCDGALFWRVRATGEDEEHSRWSAVRRIDVTEEYVLSEAERSEEPRGVIVTGDGGHVVLVCENYGNIVGRVSLTKYLGSALDWSSPISENGFFWSVRELDAGGFILGGREVDDGIILLTDEYGRETQRIYPAQGELTTPVKDIWRFDDGRIVALMRRSIPSFQLDLAFFNELGEEIWRNTHLADGFVAARMVGLEDGSVVVLGETGQGIDQSFHMARVDSGGTVVWDREFAYRQIAGGGGTSSLYRCADGGFLVTGMAHGEIAIAKVSESGQLDLYEEITLNETDDWEHDDPYDSVECPDGSYLVVGATETDAVGPYDSFAVKIDPSGNILKKRIFGNESLSFGLRVVPGPIAGESIVAGVMRPEGSGSEDLYWLRLDENLQIIDR